MDVEFDFWTGMPVNAIPSLNRSIGQYIASNSKVKIGITVDPVRRALEHEKSDEKWERLVVKYKTSSVNFVNKMEKDLIDNFREYIQNEVGGGGGPTANGEQYLYVLLKA